MNDPTSPEAIEPDPLRRDDDGHGATHRPAAAAGMPPARVDEKTAEAQQDTLTREQPEQAPSARAPAAGNDVREAGKGDLHRVPPEDAPRIVPERDGMDETDTREHDMATHPDKVADHPDSAGDRPRPL